MRRLFGSPRLLSAVIAFAVVASASSAHAQRMLRWKLKAGEKLQYTIVNDTLFTGSFGGMEVKIPNKTTTDLTISVVSVDANGVAQVKVVMDRIQVEAQSPMGAVSFDSDKPASEDGDSPVAQGMRPLVKQETNAKLSPRGEITDFKFSEAMTAAFEAANAGGGFSGGMTEDAYKSMLTGVLLPLPKDAAAKGAKWNSTDEAKSRLGKTTSTHTYEYSGSESKGGATLDAIAVVTTEKSEPDPAAQFKIEVKEYDSKGVALFDAAKGRLKSREQKTSSKMVMTIMDNPSDASVESTLTVTLK